MNTIREIQRINEEELRRNIAGTSASWHDKYRQCAWIYVGNLDRSLSEGDVLAVMSQWGEIEDLHLVRDEKTGESRGYAFVKYEDARSCILAVDNFCGILLCGRSIRVDHVENYRLPKHLAETKDVTGDTIMSTAATLSTTTGGGGGGGGHAYIGKELANEYTLERGQDLFAPLTMHGGEKRPIGERTSKPDKTIAREAKQQRKEERKKKRQEKESRKHGKERKNRDRHSHKRKYVESSGSEREHRKHKKSMHKRE